MTREEESFKRKEIEKVEVSGNLKTVSLPEFIVDNKMKSFMNRPTF